MIVYLDESKMLIAISQEHNMIQGATPGRVPIFICRKIWLCCRLANIFNLQNESFLYLLLLGKYNF